MSSKQHFRLPFGFRVQREADWVAVLALAITLMLAIFQVRQAVVGPEVKLLDPKVAAIFEFRCGSTPPNIEISIPMGFANVGAVDYDAIVSEILVTLRVDGRKLDFEAETVALFPSRSRTINQNESVVHPCTAGRATLKGFEIEKSARGNAGAVPLNIRAGSAKSELIWFIPIVLRESSGVMAKSQKNIVNLESFLSWVGDSSTIFFDFSVKVFEEKTIRKICRVAFSQSEKNILMKQRWFQPGMQC